MGDDIVTRLRCLPLDCDGTCWTCTAADEIERLRFTGDALADALSAAVDWFCCADGLIGPCWCSPSTPKHPSSGGEALAAWEEARRG